MPVLAAELLGCSFLCVIFSVVWFGGMWTCHVFVGVIGLLLWVAIVYSTMHLVLFERAHSQVAPFRSCIAHITDLINSLCCVDLCSFLFVTLMLGLVR